MSKILNDVPIVPQEILTGVSGSLVDPETPVILRIGETSDLSLFVNIHPSTSSEKSSLRRVKGDTIAFGILKNRDITHFV